MQTWCQEVTHNNKVQHLGFYDIKTGEGGWAIHTPLQLLKYKPLSANCKKKPQDYSQNMKAQRLREVRMSQWQWNTSRRSGS